MFKNVSLDMSLEAHKASAHLRFLYHEVTRSIFAPPG